jgi:cell wall-associated NlpC family hydrolase
MRIRHSLFLCAVLAAAFPLAGGAEEPYTVRKGDSLSRIARWHGVKAEALMEANGLASDRLKPGMRIAIPPRQGDSESVAAAPATVKRGSRDESAAVIARPPETLFHRVEKGETLSSIADLYGMSVRDLKGLNHIRKPRKLRAGTRILIHKPVTPASQETENAPTAIASSAPPPPAASSPESRLARELKELADSPVVKEVRELSTPPAGGSGTAGIKEKLIEIAQKMLDIPYRFGGSSLLGIDCSGYVQKVFGLLDIVLPRTAREQFRLGKLVGKEDLSIGDLVFFRTYAKFPSHVGIYLGDNRFIHASSADRKVTIDSLDAPYYIKRFIGARRLPLDEPADEI